MAYGLSRIAADLKQYGALRVVGDVTLRSVNKLIFFKVLHCMKADTVHPEFSSSPNGYRGSFLDERQLSALTHTPEWELSSTFLAQALAKGDRCYGFTFDNCVAAYQWYSTKPTDTDWRGMVAHFGGGYVYMYKGFTHPSHRGHRLYPIGVTSVLADYLRQGYRGLLSLVESNNFASLRSCHRMGYRDIGKIRLASLHDRCLLRMDRSCEEYGICLKQKDEFSR